jgi:hypothetical protein
MNGMARHGRVVTLSAGFACAAALLLTTACHEPRDTRSVHLPLAVGNRWVYNVTDDTSSGTAVIKVISQDEEAFSLSESCDCGHITGSDSLIRLKCRDTVLYLLANVSGRTRWSSILSDDPKDSCTQTLLIFRDQAGSKYTSQHIGTVVVGEDTFQDCLRLRCYHVHEGTIIILTEGDTNWVTEDYAPGVGIVRMQIEQHWWEYGWFFGDVDDAGKWVDRWELRDYSLVD